MLNFPIERFDFFSNINHNDKEDPDPEEMVKDLLVLVPMKKPGPSVSMITSIEGPACFTPSNFR